LFFYSKCTTRLHRLVHSYRDAATLMAAVELGLFTQVARGADTEAAVADALALSPTNADRLVTACMALGCWSATASASATRQTSPDFWSRVGRPRRGPGCSSASRAGPSQLPFQGFMVRNGPMLDTGTGRP
jgi:hypothetical protein